MSPIEELRFQILGAQREGNRVFASLLAGLDLTPSQAEVLRNLDEAAPLTLNALGQRLVCETGSPSRLISSMVDRQLVERRESETDRRQVVLTLTSRGAQLAQAVRKVEQQLHGWLSDRLGEDTVAAMNAALTILLEGTAAGQAITQRKSDARRGGSAAPRAGGG